MSQFLSSCFREGCEQWWTLVLKDALRPHLRWFRFSPGSSVTSLSPQLWIPGGPGLASRAVWPLKRPVSPCYGNHHTTRCQAWRRPAQSLQSDFSTWQLTGLTTHVPSPNIKCGWESDVALTKTSLHVLFLPFSNPCETLNGRHHVQFY